MTAPVVRYERHGPVAQRFVFPCDLLVCSDDAFFRDPLVQFGVGGIQAPVHTWMYGPRLAEEMLFTGSRLAATRLIMRQHYIANRFAELLDDSPRFDLPDGRR